VHNEWVVRRPTRVVVVDTISPDPAIIAGAGLLIRSGRLVAFPTETVYGLGANALDRDAVGRIFEAKGRPSTDPLIVHVGSVDEIVAIARDIPKPVTQLAARFWPGPLTLIVRKRPEVPDEVTAGLQTVAVRVPAHPVARALLAAARVPIAAPSANLFSRPSPTRAVHVTTDLDGRVDLVLDAGDTDIGVESTVLDLTTVPPIVRRPGGTSLEELRAVVPGVQLVSAMLPAGASQVSPGQLLRHYAPRARLTLFDGEGARVLDRVQSESNARTTRGSRVGILAPEEDIVAIAAALRTDVDHRRVVLQQYGSRRDPSRGARELFAAIRALDAAGVHEILAIAPAPSGIGLAVRDRLTRAADGRVVLVH
jgi:L-threonylcarbamoyladenylate synthase